MNEGGADRRLFEDSGIPRKRARVERSNADARAGISGKLIRDEGKIGVESVYDSLPEGVHSRKITIKRTEHVTVDTNLWYFPMQHSVESWFTSHTKKYFEQFLLHNNFKYVQIKVVRMRISNPIVLSDQIQLTTSGATEVSSFVQNGKILHYELGADAGRAHAYVFQKANELMKMDAMDILGNIDDNSKTKYIAKMSRETDTSRDTVEDISNIKVRPLKYDVSLTNVIDEMAPNVRCLPFFGYVRPLSATAGHVEPLLMEEYELNTVKLTDFPHDYLEPGIEIDLKCPGTVRMAAAGFALLLEEKTMPRGNVTTKLYSVPETYLSSGMRPSDGTPAYLITRANGARPNWQIHDYISLLPIRNTDGKVMKIRASIELNVIIEFEFFSTDYAMGDDIEAILNLELDTPVRLPLKECYIKNNNIYNLIIKH
uniref:Capsid protein n=1 Tax=Cecropis daurica densovirus TaxID=2794495 RepID=A0A8A4XE47_9VIRU|nr:MAG: putative capsid protein [Cecropis daurica densovirus]